MSFLGGCGDLDGTDLTVSTWAGCVVLKELMFNSFYFVWS